MYLKNGVIGQKLILHYQVHQVRLGCSALFMAVQVLLLCLQLYAADIAYCYRRANDAHHAEGIGAGITVGDGWRRSSSDARQSFCGSTKSRGICHGTIQRTNHHREIVRVCCIKESKVAHKHRYNVKQYKPYRKQVEPHASLLKAGEEARSHLKTYHKDKQDKTEVLHEVQGGQRCRKPKMASHNAGKQYKCHAKRNSSEFYLAQINAHSYYHSV